MPEENVGLVEAPATPETPAGTTSAPTSFVNDDGTFVENWTQSLDSDLQMERSLATIRNVKDLAKSFVMTKRMVGKGKIAIPNETSTEGEWQEWYKAGGRPDTAHDYGLKAPEGVPAELFPVEKLNVWQDRFHKLGISKKAAETIISEYAKDIGVDLQMHQTDQEATQKELVAGLQREWGRAYEQNVHLGNVAIEEGVKGNDEFKQRLTQKFGNDPDFIRFASNLGSKFAESKMIDTSIPTPMDIQENINEMMQTDAYMNRNNPNHKITVEKVQRLFQQKHSSQNGIS